MILKILISIPLSFLFLCSFAQQKNLAKDLELNNVSQVDGYLYTKENSSDSILITREFYNNTGFKTKIEIYDSLENNFATYKYVLRFDSLPIAFLAYKGDTLISKSVYVYNRDYIKSQATVYLGNQMNNFTTYIFSKDQKVREVREYKNKELALVTEYRYFYFGPLKEKIVKFPKSKWAVTKYRKTRYKVDLLEKYEKQYENYKDSGRKLIKNTQLFNRKGTITTLKGIESFDKKDELKTKTYYLKNGLINYIVQIKNGRFFARKTYVYQ